MGDYIGSEAFVWDERGNGGQKRVKHMMEHVQTGQKG